jgi:hypothetical protein
MIMKPQNQYCHYIENICSQIEHIQPKQGLFFAYPSKPETSVDAIKGCINLINKEKSLNVSALDWQSLPIEGSIVFCEICKAIRSVTCAAVNTTYVNFNVLFEYGFATGVGRAVWPLVEEGIPKDELVSSNIKSITTVGYSQFSNSTALYKKIIKKRPWTRTVQMTIPPALGQEPTRETIGILYLKSQHNNEPSLRISETLSTLPYEVTTDDPNEVPFRHVTWYLNQIAKSFAVVIHLGSDRMTGVLLQRAKCALVAGMALALGRRVLMLCEDDTFEPIDYRDLIKIYKNAQEAEVITKQFISLIVPALKELRAYTELDLRPIGIPKQSVLSGVDLGDYVAENEQGTLENYFYETPEYISALEPKFKVFVGRKGTGKTANYYMVARKIQENSRNIVCLIKPREYELNELVQFVKDELDSAKKGYLLESLWKFMLYSELLVNIHKRISDKPTGIGLQQSEKAVIEYFESNGFKADQSFTSRLVHTVRNLCDILPKSENVHLSISDILHVHEITRMHKIMCDYIENDNIARFAILIDGLDANWKLGENYEVMSDILLALIGAARDIWRECTKDIGVTVYQKSASILIFVRSDVFKAALERSRDPDKLQYEPIFWPSVDVLINLIARRILINDKENAQDNLNWKEMLEPGFSFDEMKMILQNNILPRPRDIIYYFQRVIFYTRLRGSKYITKRDFQSAIDEYSQYALLSLSAEAQPYIPNMLDLMLEFDQCNAILTFEEINKILLNIGIKEKDLQKVLNFLIEVNFLGYGVDNFNYRFPVSPSEDAIMLRRALRFANKNQGVRKFKIHNAFHPSLTIQ